MADAEFLRSLRAVRSFKPDTVPDEAEITIAVASATVVMASAAA